MVVDLCLFHFGKHCNVISIYTVFQFAEHGELTWSQAVSIIHGIVHLHVVAAGMSDSVAACHTVENALHV